ncbi:DNA (cytosine-5-)-methyltransferase (plasmid) [Paenibacillus polymyxa M1]|uniref:DNA cytosine methyltransferase n=1 Tax=Paenibacillus polymyxa TaxID=1406 RepID=UPI00021BBB95|nr:DNA cytosine methyltransferase [Paenibacillus polymyxa]CCC86319.1 DNA (cytosine-5-)-methyltransferase [Paenibacillus polymyxa M1]
MKESIKRLYKIKNRLYIEAKYLATFGFNIGQAIKYEIDKTNKKITVVPTQNARKHVAKTTQKSGMSVPVIDIKAEEVKDFFSKQQKIEVEIQQGKIVFTVLESTLEATNVIDFEAAKSLKLIMQKKQYLVNLEEFGKVVNYQQIDLLDLLHAEKNDIQDSMSGQASLKIKEKAIRMMSLFSGCGSIDKAFIEENYNIIFANDRFVSRALRDNHIQTYRNNIGDHIIMRDVMEFTKEDIPEVDFLAAGIPCVDFSNLNVIKNFRDEESMQHPLVEQTLNIINWSKCKGFLIENVERFLTVKGGIMIKRFKERLNKFNIITRVIDATSLGSPQKRKRAFILGLQGADPNLDIPHLAQLTTVGDAFKNIEGKPQQDMYFTPTTKTLERMKHVPQGGNINSVPIELRSKKKKFSNFCQRLDLNGYAPTITHVQDEVFIHPLLNRYLTVRETARLFSLPDDFIFSGPLTSIFEMLKNCVDFKVSLFLARTIRKQLTPLLHS